MEPNYRDVLLAGGGKVHLSKPHTTAWLRARLGIKNLGVAPLAEGTFVLLFDRHSLNAPNNIARDMLAQFNGVSREINGNAAIVMRRELKGLPA